MCKSLIELIEKLGRDAHLRNASLSEVEKVLRNAQIDSEIRAALLAGDRSRLEALLGVRPVVCCAIDVPNIDEVENQKSRNVLEQEKDKAA